MSGPAFKTAVRIRRATPADSDVCGRVFYEAFATINRSHNFPPEFPGPEAGAAILRMLFSHPGFYCVVAESGGRVVGSNCLDERSIIAGLGPVSVDPEFQDRGIGRLLMESVLARGRERGFAGVRLLQSAFHSRSLALYTRLGFIAREPVSVMHGPAVRIAMDGVAVRPATEADVGVCSQLCERVHGYDRSAELREAIGQATARVVERNGRVTGYAAGFGYLGHAVAESNMELQALISTAENVTGPGLLVPTRNAELFRWCLDNGLRIFQPMTLMTIGLYNDPAGPYLPSVLS